MSYTNWINIGSFIDGDVTVYLSKGEILSNSITFLLDIYSAKYDKVDISFEYKIQSYENWRNDAIITSSTSTYALNNKLFGLSASKYGFQNTFKWNYDKNLLSFGSSIQVRITILPRSINFSESNINNINLVSQAYEKNKSDLDIISTKNIINKDREGRYICFEGSYVNVYSDVTNTSSDFVVLYPAYDPKYATQRENSRYLIADQYNGDYGYYAAIIDTESVMSFSGKSLYITDSTESIVFIDISEESNTILVCKEGVGVSELIWDDAIISTNTIWQSDTSIITNPVCATYGKYNNIIICDKDKNTVFIYNRNSGEYKEINRYKQVNNSVTEENSLIYKPFRAYELDDGNIWICEKDGKVIDFELYGSSSSSYSSDSSVSSDTSSSCQ